MYCTLTDQCYHTVELEKRPLRIISLVPSQTELLIDLGLEEHLVGITRFCEYPQGLKDRITVVGGTKKVVSSRLWELEPDLIICNKEENTQEIVFACQEIVPTYVSDINNLEQALEMISDVGKMTGTTFKAKSLATQIKINFNHLTQEKSQPLKALYLIWKNPYMSIGKDTFIHDMMSQAGLENCCADASRYPELTIEQMIAMQPDVILLSSEPYPFNQEQCDDLDYAFKEHCDAEVYTEQGRSAKANSKKPLIKLVDGTYFSWYGSRLLKAPDYFKEQFKK